MIEYRQGISPKEARVYKGLIELSFLVREDELVGLGSSKHGVITFD